MVWAVLLKLSFLRLEEVVVLVSLVGLLLYLLGTMSSHGGVSCVQALLRQVIARGDWELIHRLWGAISWLRNNGSGLTACGYQVPLPFSPLLFSNPHNVYFSSGYPQLKLVSERSDLPHETPYQLVCQIGGEATRVLRFVDMLNLTVLYLIVEVLHFVRVSYFDIQSN